MNNIWTVILLVAICIVVSFLLSYIFIPLAWVGLLAAIGVIGAYLFKKNKRTR